MGISEAASGTERAHASGRSRGWLQRSVGRLALAAGLLAAALASPAGPAAAADTLVVANATTTGYPSIVLTVDVPPAAPPLGPGELVVSEDGAPVAATVERFAGPDLEVVLAVDTSVAVDEAALAAVRAAAASFAGRLPAVARVGLVRFGGGAEVVLAPTADRAALTTALDGLRRGGDIPLYDGVVTAGRAFTPAARQRVVVLVSAGGDDSSADGLDVAVDAVRGARVEVVSLETPLTSPLALARLAIEGRGSVNAATARTVGATFDAVADALVGRYVLTYTSSGGGSVVVRVASPYGTVDSRLDLPAPPRPAPTTVPAPPAPPTTAAPAAPSTTAAAPTTAATVSPVPTVVPVPAPTVAPAPAPTVAPTAAPAGGSSGGGGAGGLVAVLVVAGLGVAGLVVLARRRSPSAPAPAVAAPAADAGAAVDAVAEGDAVSPPAADATAAAADDAAFRDRLAARVDRDLRESLDDVTGRRVVAVAPALDRHDDAADDDTAGADARYDYERFSALTGPLRDVEADGVADGDDPDGAVRVHRVAYRPSLDRRQRAFVLPLLAVNMALATGFYVWLIRPAHLPDTSGRGAVLAVLAYVMLAGIALIEGMRLISSFALSWWAWRARDPIPVRPEAGLRVAFTTTIVPSKEPIEVVRRTLEAARRVEYDGTFDVWLLDEGNDPAVRAMCRELGVRHFTRKDVAKWNRPSGRYKARTKHGNHNAWLAAHGRHYDIEISVDPDHAPLPNMAERLLGYFRDPDVAFVCGPQVYGNYDSFLTRAAESQAYLFQSVIQRAANRDECGMFVGTNHAYRIDAWRQIGGFQDSITEDMATSFAVHGARNAVTGNPWRSVYTPDVIAVGEGPATWTDFFSQQLRWSRGTDEVLVRGGLRRFRSLPTWGRRLHYALLCSYYPFVATGWMLGLLLSAVYVLTGATGLHLTDLRSWFTLYADLAIVQASLYFWLRRLNVSPHEPEGSAGVAGMFVSMLATPVYVTALVGSVLKRPLSFVVTPKGASATADGWHTFRRHLHWGALSIGVMAAALLAGRAVWAALLAPVICLFVSATPLVLWLVQRRDVDEEERPALRVVRDEEDLMLAGHSA